MAKDHQLRNHVSYRLHQDEWVQQVYAVFSVTDLDIDRWMPHEENIFSVDHGIFHADLLQL